MATLGLRRSVLLATPLFLSTPLLAQRLHKPIYCDGPDMFNSASRPYTASPGTSAQPGLRTSNLKQSGFIDAKVVRQISMGSILGVLCGMGISVFSKPLAVLMGLSVVVVQLLASRGIHIFPSSYLQRRIKNVNISRLLTSNPAMKMSFGITFALAAFAEF